MSVIRIGTRGSPLARRQTGLVSDLVAASHAGIELEEVVISTAGDRDPDRAAVEFDLTGVFVREIQEALLAGRIDVAVHSVKDLPAVLPDGLCLAAFPAREDPRDALVTRDGVTLQDLPGGARVGTGSPRRRAQLSRSRPDLAVIPIRGNIDTRLRKLAAGEIDALILAMAGLKRLGVVNGVLPLDEELWLPAPGQGALGLEIRAADERTARLLEPLDDLPTRREIEAERVLLRALGAGCQVPLAARARVSGDRLSARALVASPDGARQAAAAVEGVADEALSLGRELGERLLAAGGEAILLEARRRNP